MSNVSFSGLAQLIELLAVADQSIELLVGADQSKTGKALKLLILDSARGVEAIAGGGNWPQPKENLRAPS